MKVLYLLVPAGVATVIGNAEFPSSELLKLVRDWGIVCVLIWIIYYFLTSVLPNLNQAHKETVERLGSGFASTAKEMLSDYREEMQVTRQAYQDQTQKLVDTLTEHLERGRGE